ncbi:MAG TPA: NAD(P)(+) transhydrogenase (Re/Si-specific) subunit beta [Anaeromyxobacteraceae bacterium]|nr:NAD(P)(+) transhydrogenase (Re/Si-specific) subunit beta [Anaeromyxobacteraceae bacterium]
MTRDLLIQASYLASSVLFVLGLRSLTRPDSARRGMHLAAIGMLVAVVGTLLHREIVDFRWIVAGLTLGSLIGYPMGMWVPMTAMPQRIAISHMFGALAATLVGIAEFETLGRGASVGHAQMAALGFEVLFGSLTITGSLMAFLKLQELLPGAPVTFRGQNLVSLALFGAGVILLALLVGNPGQPLAFHSMAAVGLAFGVSLVLPIGGADMPVVISLLNSYAGLASAATGFAIGNNVLVIAGALDGASGFILSIVMSKAMNRSFTNVLFGAFGTPQVAAGRSAAGLAVRAITPEDAAIQLAYARKVIVVPGYGLAVSQAQHQIRELAGLVEKNGGDVIYAIHPVAGRMPGHMNVLLAEADVPYDRLREMEEVNPEFGSADLVLVIGANDVVNPAAKHDPKSPIYGMPILEVEQAKNVLVLKRSMNPGFAGIENELFYMPQTSMLFGDAKQSLQRLIAEVRLA